MELLAGGGLKLPERIRETRGDQAGLVLGLMDQERLPALSTPTHIPKHGDGRSACMDEAPGLPY